MVVKFVLKKEKKENKNNWNKKLFDKKRVNLFLLKDNSNFILLVVYNLNFLIILFATYAPLAKQA